MSGTVYETQELLVQYLLFHYGSEEDQLPHKFGPVDALNFPTRCVSECLDLSRLPVSARALDLGCSVGRSSFELARHCTDVLGIDFSHTFIDAANEMKKNGRLSFAVHEEGPAYRVVDAQLSETIERSRVAFETGDACNLREDLEPFDVVLMANLLDRIPNPVACLDRLPGICNPGAQLVITSPCTWLPEFTLCSRGRP